MDDIDDALDESYYDDGLSTEREVIALLARRWTYFQRTCTVEQLYKAIDVLIDPDLNEAERRMVLIEAIRPAWRMRLNGRAPTKDEYNQVIDDIIRAVGDGRTFGLPKRRHMRPTKRKAAIISLVPKVEDEDENDN